VSEHETASTSFGEYSAVAVIGKVARDDDFILFRGVGSEVAWLGSRTFASVSGWGDSATMEFVDTGVVAAYEYLRNGDTWYLDHIFIIDLERSLLDWSCFQLVTDKWPPVKLGPDLWTGSSGPYFACINCVSFLDRVYRLSISWRAGTSETYFVAADSLAVTFRSEDILSTTVFWHSGKVTRGMEVSLSRDNHKCAVVRPVWYDSL
jgi:hypothetical protein